LVIGFVSGLAVRAKAPAARAVGFAPLSLTVKSLGSAACKQQIPPLRFAPVGMTIVVENPL
jgi:hypothetical protein